MTTFEVDKNTKSSYQKEKESEKHFDPFDDNYREVVVVSICGIITHVGSEIAVDVGIAEV